ncbi:MAG: S24 family peptidase, partial [Planctomycetota bacterium]|jgi:SOS-response transcriptional repressor LexA
MDLLQRVEDSLRKPDCSWREAGIDLRRWAERTLATISGYCPEPFYIFNNIPDTVEAYRRITDRNISTDSRERIVAALTSPEFKRVMHALAHDEELTKPVVEDGLRVLKDCHKGAVKPEIARLKTLYRHRQRDRAVPASVQILSLDDVLPDTDLGIKGRAAAARDGVGVTWIEHATSRLSDYQLALVKGNVLAPIALVGQYVLLDPTDSPPEDSDLVVAEDADGNRYARRFWMCGETASLEAVNLTSPHRPVHVGAGFWKARRIVGVLFDGLGPRARGHVADEWAPTSGRPATVFSGVAGIRVEGECMEPIARDGQVVLVRETDVPTSVATGDLACVDCEFVGAVIKRCYPDTGEWTLCPVNPTDIKEPIRVQTADVRHAYRLVGVLFELACELD